MGTISGSRVSPGRSVRWTELSRKGFAVGVTYHGQEKRQNPYEIELPQSIIDSFARFLVPEIQKFYASDQGQKELEAWEKKYSDQSKE